jgi:hypothetical protein
MLSRLQKGILLCCLVTTPWHMVLAAITSCADDAPTANTFTKLVKVQSDYSYPGSLMTGTISVFNASQIFSATVPDAIPATKVVMTMCTDTTCSLKNIGVGNVTVTGPVAATFASTSGLCTILDGPYSEISHEFNAAQFACDSRFGSAIVFMRVFNFAKDSDSSLACLALAVLKIELIFWVQNDPPVVIGSNEELLLALPPQITPRPLGTISVSDSITLLSVKNCLLQVSCLFSGCIIYVSSQAVSSAAIITPHVASGGNVLTFSSNIPDISAFLPYVYISLSESSNFMLGSIINVSIAVDDATAASSTIRGGPKRTVIIRTYKVTLNSPNQRPSVTRDFDSLYPDRGEDGSRWISRLVSSYINILGSDSSLPFTQRRSLMSLRSEVTKVIPWSDMSLSPFLSLDEVVYDVALAVDMRRSVVLDKSGFFGVPGSQVIVGDIRIVDSDADDKNMTATISIPSFLSASGWSVSFLQLSTRLITTSSATSVTLIGAASLIRSAFNQVRVQIGSAVSATLTIEVTDSGAWVLPPYANAVRSSRLSSQFVTTVYGEVKPRNIRPVPRIIPEVAHVSIGGEEKEKVLLQFSDIYDVDYGDAQQLIEVRITAESCASLGFSPLHPDPTAGAKFLGTSKKESTSDLHFESKLESARLTLQAMFVQGRNAGRCKVTLFVNDRFANKDGPKQNSVFMDVIVLTSHQNQPPLLVGPSSIAMRQIMTIGIPKEFLGIRLYDQDYMNNEDLSFTDMSIYIAVSAYGGTFSLNSFQDAFSSTTFARRVRPPRILTGSTTNFASVKFVATFKAVNNMLSRIQFSSLLLGDVSLTISITNSSGDAIRMFPILIKSYPLNAAPKIVTSLKSQENIFLWIGSNEYRIKNRRSVLSPYKVVPSDVSYNRPKDVAFYVISGQQNSGDFVIPFEIVESGCSMSGRIRVEMVVQNVNSSWTNFGRWMGWFQCRQGPTICVKQNPSLSLNSTTGLTFISQPDYWNIGDGTNDYRMMFEGSLDDVRKAMSFVTFRGKTNGYDMLGSNIINVIINDVEVNVQYAEETNVFWAPNGLFQTSCGISVQQSKVLCSNAVYTMNSICYGFHFLTAQQYTASVRSNYISGTGIPPPVCTDGQTLTLFYRETFVAYPIFGTFINARAFIRLFDPDNDMNICLGPQPSSTLTLDARVLDQPINLAPSISIEKTNWFIQAGYQFPLAGFVILDGDMFVEPRGDIALTFNATRGAFTFFNQTGLTFLLGTGVEDRVVTVSAQVDRCIRALTEVQFRSASTTGIDVIVVTVNDQGTSGELGEKSASVAINLDLRKGPYNLPPSLNIPPPKQREFEIGLPHVIRDIFSDDPDWDRPRYDKLIPQAELELTISCQTCLFSIPYMRAEGGGGYGTRKMVNSPDQMTTLFKVRAYLPYLNKILNEVEIIMPAATSDVLRFVMTDLGNTGFSDDSGADFARETSDFLVIFGVPPAFKLGLRRVYFNLLGNDNFDCLSLVTSCKSLKRACEVSQTGDEVIVGAGVYTGQLNLNILIPSARFFIVGPPLDTMKPLVDDEQYAIFDCQGLSAAFLLKNMDSSPVFQNLIFRNCRENSNNGGAVKISGSSPVFVNCSFQRCSCSGSGGAVSIDGKSSPIFERCNFDGNSATLGGGKKFS